MAPGLKEKLTNILIDKNLIKEAGLQKALALQKEKGGSVSDALARIGLAFARITVVAVGALDADPAFADGAFLFLIMGHIKMLVRRADRTVWVEIGHHTGASIFNTRH